MCWWTQKAQNISVTARPRAQRVYSSCFHPTPRIKSSFYVGVCLLRGLVETPARCSRQIFPSTRKTASIQRKFTELLLFSRSTPAAHGSTEVGPTTAVTTEQPGLLHTARPCSAMDHKRVVLLLLWASIWAVCDAAAACSVCPAQDKCVFRVLALGDSLTRGAVPSTSSSHSYSIKMSDVLRNRLGSRSTKKATVAVTTAGA